MKRKILRHIRNVSISVVVLLILTIVTGLAYTWFMGRTAPPSAAVGTSEAAKVTPTIKHVEPAANAKVSASVQSLTTPVAPGENASIIVKTNSGSWCTILVEYNKIASKDSGLVGRTADEFGTVSWTWTVEASVPTGKWPVTVTCVRNKLSAVVIGDLIVTVEQN